MGGAAGQPLQEPVRTGPRPSAGCPSNALAGRPDERSADPRLKPRPSLLIPSQLPIHRAVYLCPARIRMAAGQGRRGGLNSGVHGCDSTPHTSP